MNTSNGHFGKDFKNLAAYATNTNYKYFDVLKGRFLSIDKFKSFEMEGERIFHHWVLIID